MSLKYYTVLFLFVILSSSIKAQNIPEGYRYLGDLDISQSDYYPTELKYFKEANVIAINSGAGKSLTEVFNIDSWEKVGNLLPKSGCILGHLLPIRKTLIFFISEVDENFTDII